MNTDEETAALVIGASGGIGMAALEALGQRHAQVIAISRDAAPDSPIHARSPTWLQIADVETDGAEAVRQIAAVLEETGTRLARVVICSGTLHGAGYRPEKSLRELNSTALLHVYSVNAVQPLLWLARLESMLRASGDCVVAVLSARVGSIGDNHLGGWYSYRASKAGLNMLLRSAAVELSRRSPALKLIAFHPGTTDTALSKPFQARMDPDKLFSTAFVADRLLERMDEARADGELGFVDWAGERIPW